MTDSDLETAREMIRGWNEGNVDRMIDFWCEDGDWIWEDAPELPGARVVEGREAVEAHLREVLSFLSDVKLHVEELTKVNGRVLAMVGMRATGAHSGLEMEGQVVHLVDFEDGRVRRYRVFRDREDAIAAAHD